MGKKKATQRGGAAPAAAVPVAALAEAERLYERIPSSRGLARATAPLLVLSRAPALDEATRRSAVLAADALMAESKRSIIFHLDGRVPIETIAGVVAALGASFVGDVFCGPPHDTARSNGGAYRQMFAAEWLMHEEDATLVEACLLDAGGLALGGAGVAVSPLPLWSPARASPRLVPSAAHSSFRAPRRARARARSPRPRGLSESRPAASTARPPSASAAMAAQACAQL